jgi:hypothetical protein
LLQRMLVRPARFELATSCSGGKGLPACPFGFSTRWWAEPINIGAFGVIWVGI